MKIVVFKSGLGNQIFVYLLCQYFRDKGYRVFSYSTKEWLKGHNGLEISKWFDIDMPPRSTWADIIAIGIRAIKSFFPRLLASDYDFRENAIYYDGYWQDKKFFNGNVTKIKFKDFYIAEKNMQMINEIQSSFAVSLHIRRGDYMDISRQHDYAHSCPIEYYEKAISYASGKSKAPFFVVFSDDIEWVKEHLTSIKPYHHIFVDWNTGKDSFYDLFLMSHCQGSIIANSSFSYWGAMLGREKDFVIRPKKWIGEWIPDIFPERWIIMDGE